MNPLGELLTADDYRVEVDATDRAELFDRAAALLAVRSGIPPAAIVAGLTARERLGSTGVGHGVAMPHARMSQCVAAAGVLVRTRSPIAFDAPDHKPVSIFLVLIVPNRATDQHLRLLATAAAMFDSRVFRQALQSAPLATTLRESVDAWSEASPIGKP